MHTLPSRLPAPAAHQSNKPCHHFFDVPPSHTHAHTPTSPPRLSSRQTKRVSVKLRGTATHTYQTFVESLYIPPIHPPLCARQAPLCSQSQQSQNSSTQPFPITTPQTYREKLHQPKQTSTKPNYPSCPPTLPAAASARPSWSSAPPAATAATASAASASK